MTNYELLQQRLSAMPEEQREGFASLVLQEVLPPECDPLENLTPAQTERLAQMIQEGIDSGPAVPWDCTAFLKRCHNRLQSHSELH